jgi:antitoxin (DNA-binding transcriptional repressor) of toxin-antitoxin stability system
MRQLPIEQNDRTASVMAYVEHGETVEVTRQGRVIGRISPATGGELHSRDRQVNPALTAGEAGGYRECVCSTPVEPCSVPVDGVSHAGAAPPGRLRRAAVFFVGSQHG